MTDFSKLSAVVGEAAAPAKAKVNDSTLTPEKKQAIKDAIAKRKAEAAEAKKYANFKITDSYKNLLKKIKDELAETETTEEAVNCAIECLNEIPAEQAIAAVTEVLAEAIDILEAQVAEQEPVEPTNPEPPVDEPVVDSVKEPETDEDFEEIQKMLAKSGILITLDELKAGHAAYLADKE